MQDFKLGNKYGAKPIIMENNTPNQQENLEILSIVKWWEKKRLIFNILIGASGLTGLIIFDKLSYLSSIIGLMFWYAIIANLCYCLGWGDYILKLYYKKETTPDIAGRNILFYLGLLFSLFITFYGTYLFEGILLID